MGVHPVARSHSRRVGPRLGHIRRGQDLHPRPCVCLLDLLSQGCGNHRLIFSEIAAVAHQILVGQGGFGMGHRPLLQFVERQPEPRECHPTSDVKIPMLLGPGQNMAGFKACAIAAAGALAASGRPPRE